MVQPFRPGQDLGVVAAQDFAHRSVCFRQLEGVGGGIGQHRCGAVIGGHNDKPVVSGVEGVKGVAPVAGQLGGGEGKPEIFRLQVCAAAACLHETAGGRFGGTGVDRAGL